MVYTISRNVIKCKTKMYRQTYKEAFWGGGEKKTFASFEIAENHYVFENHYVIHIRKLG